MNQYDVVVIGGGPAGLAAAAKARDRGVKVLLIEREGRLGGILKQCIHDGFGLIRFKEKLTGPEYAEREIKFLTEHPIAINLLTFVTKITRMEDGFLLSLVSRKGVRQVSATNIVLATGCRERTAKQVAIHGTNPAGVLTAGMAQYYINILGKMPTKRCVILGSGDIGLIMARRITLEGGKVEGVYEIKPTPSGLSRNIVQCLEDFDIPLHLSHTVTRVYGDDRLTGVQIAKVDQAYKVIPGTERYIECDALILSVGLIPENEMAENLEVPINPKTKGPYCDQTMETLVDGIYSCGNSLHVSDLADYVSETGELAGISSSLEETKKTRELIEVAINEGIAYTVPSHIDLNKPHDKVVFYFRSKENVSLANLIIKANDVVIKKAFYPHLKTPEMERIEVDLSSVSSLESLAFTLEVKA